MNMLIDILPTSVEIESIEYEINTDFRTSMLFELLMQDNEMEDKEKMLGALQLYYPVVPRNIKEAVEQILWFYRCGKDIVKSKGVGKGKKANGIYSFEFDDDYIYAAFLDQYNIDLQDIEDLHWWKFRALFKSLKEDNEIVKIMGYRSMDLRKIKDKNEKEHYKKMQELYKLPERINKDEQEKLDEVKKALMNNGDLSQTL